MVVGVVGVVGIVAAGAVIAARVVVGEDRATPLAAADVARVGGAAAGRYAYATTGYESVDALGGTRHDYPKRTILSVSAPDGAGCVTLRWTPLAERSDEFVVCLGTDGAMTLPRYENVHQFFGRTDRRTYTCDPPLRFPAAPGASDGTCGSGKIVQTLRAEVVGEEQVDVGGTPLTARHVVLDGPVAGGTVKSGHTRYELWLRADGVPVRLTASGRTTSPQFVGDVHFEEEYDLRMASPTPLGS